MPRGIESNFINAEVLAAAGQNGLAWPGHPAVTQIQRLMADAVNMALSGTLSPKEALDQAAEEVTKFWRTIDPRMLFVCT